MNDTPVISETANQPTSNLPANPPVGTIQGMGLCCACPASSRVIRRGDGNYYRTPIGHWNDDTRSNIAITRTTTGGQVLVTKKCRFSYTNGATSDQHYGVLLGAVTSAMTAWTTAASDYKIILTQPGCEVQILDIVFAAEEVAMGQDVKIIADNKTPAILPDNTTEELLSFVQDATEMVIYLQDPTVNWTMIHEMGHVFGLPDEYTYDRPTNTAPTITYIGADNPDETITLGASSIPPVAPELFAFDNPTIMGEANNTTYETYMFFWIAVEVKDILARNGVNADVRVLSIYSSEYPVRPVTPTTTN